MADELLDLEGLDDEINNTNKVEKRIKDLSQGKKDALELADTERVAKEAEATARASAEKERDFYKDFSGVATKYPGASEYQDVIKEKVTTSGYSIEDATITTLAAQGKLNIAAPQVERETVAGGSTLNQLPSSGGVKTVAEMSQEERKQSIMEAEKRGDITV